MTQSSYLVTGAAGFIGSHLVERLLERGNGVIGVDCFTDFYNSSIKHNNLRETRNHPDFRLFNRDLIRFDMKRWLDEIDGIYHQAAQAGVRDSWGDRFTEYVNSNVRATQYLLESVKRHRPDLPVIMASSSSVYGIPDELPMRETMHVQPFSPYGVTKLASEHLGVLYAENFDLRTVNLRYFTVFGPRQRPDMAFTRFLTWALEELPVSVYGDGTQTRDFTYVDDIVEANLTVMEDPNPGAVYNVGGGNRSSLQEVFDSIESLIDGPLNLQYESKVKGDVPHTDASVERIRDDYGWTAETNLREGLERQFEWLRDRPDVMDAVLDDRNPGDRDGSR